MNWGHILTNIVWCQNTPNKLGGRIAHIHTISVQAVCAHTHVREGAGGVRCPLLAACAAALVLALAVVGGTFKGECTMGVLVGGGCN